MISSERFNVILKSAISGIFAGFFIALGGISYIFCLAYISDQGLAKVLGSLIFTVGLFFVCVLGVFLYTGRIGYVFEKDDYKFTKLITMLLFNLLAAYLFGLVCYFIFQNDTNLINSVNNLTLNKINFLTDYYLPLKLMAKGFLCGALVFIATYIYKFSKTAVFKYLGIVIPIFIFVLCGFEHCIANAFYFGFSFVFDWFALLNLVLVIIFNSLGSIMFYLGFKFISVKIIDKKDEKNEE